MSLYAFEFDLIKDSSSAAQSDPDLINTSADPDAILRIADYVATPPTIITGGIIELPATMKGQDEMGLLPSALKAAQWEALIHTAADPDTILLDFLGVASAGTILSWTDKKEPHVIPGQNYDMFGYI